MRVQAMEAGRFTPPPIPACTTVVQFFTTSGVAAEIAVPNTI
jgi:hypothetical protein